MSNNIQGFIEDYDEKHPFVLNMETKKLDDEIITYFTKYVPLTSSNLQFHDQFFIPFNDYWYRLLKNGETHKATRFYEKIIECLLKFETVPQNRIHKGTPYYWAGASSIFGDDLTKGFLYIHQALKEDQETSNIKNPQSPAYFFVTLDYQNTGQALFDTVKKMSEYLSTLINEFDTSYTIDEFRDDFLQNNDLIETVFYYVYSLFRIERLLTRTRNEFIQSDFSSLLLTGMLFDITRITEITLSKKIPDCDFQQKLIELSKLTGKKFQWSREKVRQNFSDINEAFEKLLETAPDSFYGITMEEIEKQILLVYKLRNHTAHDLKNIPVVYEQFPKMVQAVMNVLFYSVRNLFS